MTFAKSQKVNRSPSLKNDGVISVQLSTGDDFTIAADGETRAIDALLRLCFRRNGSYFHPILRNFYRNSRSKIVTFYLYILKSVPAACSVQWSLSVGSVRSGVLSSNWLQLTTDQLAGAKVFGEVRVNLRVIFEIGKTEMIEARAKPHKLLQQVIQHVLQKLQVDGWRYSFYIIL